MAEEQLEAEFSSSVAFPLITASLSKFDLATDLVGPNRKQKMFLLDKQVSKPNATLEQTQEPSPKPSLRELPLQGTTGNGLVTHTQLCLISLC